MGVAKNLKFYSFGRRKVKIKNANVIRIGSSLGITIPKEIVESNSLKVGTQLDVQLDFIRLDMSGDTFDYLKKWVAELGLAPRFTLDKFVGFIIMRASYDMQKQGDETFRDYVRRVRQPEEKYLDDLIAIETQLKEHQFSLSHKKKRLT